MGYAEDTIQFYINKSLTAETKLRNLVDACSDIEHFGVGRIGCDIDHGSRWAPSHRFSDLFNKMLNTLRAAKEE